MHTEGRDVSEVAVEDAIDRPLSAAVGSLYFALDWKVWGPQDSTTFLSAIVNGKLPVQCKRMDSVSICQTFSSQTFE